MTKKDLSDTLTWAVIAIIGVGGTYGYFANVYKLLSAEVIGEVVARGAGIVIPPIGAIMGFF